MDPLTLTVQHVIRQTKLQYNAAVMTKTTMMTTTTTTTIKYMGGGNYEKLRRNTQEGRCERGERSSWGREQL